MSRARGDAGRRTAGLARIQRRTREWKQELKLFKVEGAWYLSDKKERGWKDRRLDMIEAAAWRIKHGVKHGVG